MTDARVIEPLVFPFRFLMLHSPISINRAPTTLLLLVVCCGRCGCRGLSRMCHSGAGGAALELLDDDVAFGVAIEQFEHLTALRARRLRAHVDVEVARDMFRNVLTAADAADVAGLLTGGDHNRMLYSTEGTRQHVHRETSAALLKQSQLFVFDTRTL